MNLAHEDCIRTEFELPAKSGIFLLLLLLAACAKEPAADGETFDLRPRFEAGETYEIREEGAKRWGTGPFPPAGELAARSEGTSRELHVYREEVREAEESLLRTRRTYLTSSKDGEPTPVQGKTYEITDLFTTCGVKLVGPDGEPRTAPPDAVKQVRLCGFRMGGSLLPGAPVPLRSTWVPGRDMNELAIPGRKTVEMVPVLRSVRDSGGRQVATVECATDVLLLDGPYQRTRMTLRETVRVDVSAGRFLRYRSITEYHGPPTPGRAEQWRRQETEATFRLLP